VIGGILIIKKRLIRIKGTELKKKMVESSDRIKHAMRVSPECEYKIELGLHVFVPNIQRKHFFAGQCYKCSSWRHTLHFCPLQYCTFCCKYGHHHNICKKKKTSSIYGILDGQKVAPPVQAEQ
jgi:hypothetical protein